MISSERDGHNRGAAGLAVFASGAGTTLENLVAACADGRIPGRVRLVLTDRPGIRAIEVAARSAIPAKILDWKECGGAEAFSIAAFAEAERSGCELILLAGFLRKLQIPDAWLGRVLNIHPALLPLFGGQSMYGRRVHEAVIASGMRVSGCTVHYADEAYDRGPIIVQSAVPVFLDDNAESLEARVRLAENEAYPRAVRLLLEGRARLEAIRPASTDR